MEYEAKHTKMIIVFIEDYIQCAIGKHVKDKIPSWINLYSFASVKNAISEAAELKLSDGICEKSIDDFLLTIPVFCRTEHQLKPLIHIEHILENKFSMDHEEILYIADTIKKTRLDLAELLKFLQNENNKQFVIEVINGSIDNAKRHPRKSVNSIIIPKKTAHKLNISYEINELYGVDIYTNNMLYISDYLPDYDLESHSNCEAFYNYIDSIKQNSSCYPDIIFVVGVIENNSEHGQDFIRHLIFREECYTAYGEMGNDGIEYPYFQATVDELINSIDLYSKEKSNL